MIASRPTSATWPLFARGGLSLVFGLTALLLVVLAVLMPGIVAALLLVLFACFVLVEAGLAVGRLLFARVAAHERLALLVRAALTLGIGIAAFAGPIAGGRPWERLGGLVSVWALVNGLLDIGAGCGVFAGPRQRWQVVLGALSVLLGTILLVWPPSMMALTLWIVAFSTIYGGVTLVEATRHIRTD